MGRSCHPYYYLKLLCLMINFVPIKIFLETFLPLNLSSNVSTAVSPIISVYTFTVERGGFKYLQIYKSFIPIIFTRVGTGIFSSIKARNAPIANLSFAAKNAVGKLLIPLEIAVFIIS